MAALLWPDGLLAPQLYILYILYILYTFGPLGLPIVTADRLASNIIRPLHRLRLMKCIAAPCRGGYT